MWLIWGVFLLSQPLIASVLILLIQDRVDHVPKTDLGEMTKFLSFIAVFSCFLPGLYLKQMKDNPNISTAKLRYNTYILRWAGFEAVGLCGFCLGLMGVAVEVWSLFFVAPVLLLLFFRPRIDSAPK